MRRIGIPALGLAALLAGCGSGSQGPVAGEEFQALSADQVMYGLEHYVTSEGVRQAVLNADSAHMYDDSARVDLWSVHLKLYQASGQEAADLTSETGRLNRLTEAMTASGNVVLVTREAGRRIETEELHFDPRTRRIWSDVPTKLTEDGTTLRGSGFTADSELRNIELRDPRGRTKSLELGF